MIDICQKKTYNKNMTWKIEFTATAQKQIKKLSSKAFDALRLLVKDLQKNGSNYGKLHGKKQKINGIVI